ncbi:MAG: hypothetical protein HKN50_08335, partial [Gammaproteobacteria bacterium]|nr:hypothetical protein [Gammaproteobacteria bacterium]
MSRGRLLTGLLIIAIVVFSGPTRADEAQGIAWLVAQQDAISGGFYTDQDTAHPFQATNTAVALFSEIGSLFSQNLTRARQYLFDQDAHSTEFIAHRLANEVANGGLSAGTLSNLINLQNPDGGFGPNEGHRSTPMDTAFALHSLYLAGRSEGAASERAIQYLAAQQLLSAAWSQFDQPSAYATALSIRALAPFRNRDTSVNEAVISAENFLLGHLIGTDISDDIGLGALILLTLTDSLPSASSLNAAINELRSAQLANGSWGDDVYSTALAIRALDHYQARTNGAQPGSGALSGFVLRAGSSEPLAAATVSLRDQGIEILTNADGHFIVPDLTAGSYTLVVSKPGFQTINRVVQVENGGIAQGGNIHLQPAPALGIFDGTVFDDQSREALSGALIELSGSNHYIATSASDGSWSIPAVQPGQYAYFIELAGYQPVSGTLQLDAGQTLLHHLGLLAVNAFADAAPVALQATVLNGSDGMPIVGAILTLGGLASARSDSQGLLVVEGVPRGNYSGSLSAPGFAALSVQISLPAGHSGQLGVVTLYPENEAQQPDAITILGSVVNALTGAPVGNASVQLDAGDVTVATDLAGEFVLQGILVSDFVLSVGAPGLVSKRVSVSVDGRGEIALEIGLSPPGSGINASTVSGQIIDQSNQTGIAGVVSIPDLGLVATADDDGLFEISGVSELNFDVLISAPGYESLQRSIQLSGHGEFDLGAIAMSGLDSPQLPDIEVVSVIPRASVWSADQTALFDLTLLSRVAELQDVLVIAEVIDQLGRSVAQSVASDENALTSNGIFSIAPNESIALLLPWPTKQFAAGEYRVDVRAMVPDSITEQRPRGITLSQNSAWISVRESRAILGAVQADPPLLRAGDSTPVRLHAAIRNSGNQPIASAGYRLTVTESATGQELLVREVYGDGMSVSGTTELEFGQWLPTAIGELSMTIKAVDTSIVGEISNTLYIGDTATGHFTVDRDLVSLGRQMIRGAVDLRGIDASTGVSTDPLFALIKDALVRANGFVDPEVINFDNQNRCLACHIQSQSLVGMAEASDKIGINNNSIKHLYNRFTSVQAANGEILHRRNEHQKDQTLLALWALGSDKLKQHSVRSRYRALKYLQSFKNTEADRVHWSGDIGNWWGPPEASTYLVVKELVDLLDRHQQEGDAAFADYSLVSKIQTPTRVEDMAVAADGNILYVDQQSELRKLHVDTAQIELIDDELPAGSKQLLIARDGTIYVAVDGWLIQVDPHGPNTTISSIGTVVDWVEMADGNLALLGNASSSTREVRIIDLQGALLQRIRSPRLHRGSEIALSPNGALYVSRAHQTHREINLVSTQGYVFPVIQNLTTRPISIEFDTAGNLFATHALTSGVSQTTRGLYVINAEGFLHHVPLPSTSELERLEVHGDKVFVLDRSSSEILYLDKRVPADLEQTLQTFRNDIDGALNFYLQQQDSEVTTAVAGRILGLYELLPSIADATRLVQADQLLDSDTDRLFAGQAANGGWPLWFGADDIWVGPILTAFAGIALDVTNPSDDDPRMRRMVDYLLNTQLSDGSWPARGKPVTSDASLRLAPTSMVMTYLPTLLDRFGALDVELNIEFPANVVPHNSVPAPDSQTPHRSWSLTGVTGQGQQVQFDLDLLDMQANETRPVASAAWLEFANSFTDETLRLNLEIPQVTAVSDLRLTELSTDKRAYFANEDVHILALAQNIGSAVVSGQLDLFIEAAAGGDVLAALPSQPLSNLGAGLSLALADVWNTAATFPSQLQVRAELRDDAGALLNTLISPVEILAPATPLAGQRIVTDRRVYGAWDVVELTGRLSNLSVNTTLPETLLQISATDPSGNIIFEAERTAMELGLGGALDSVFNLPLQDAPAGDYQIALQVLDDFSHTPLGSAVQSFTVARPLAAELLVDVTVQHNSIDKGSDNLCTAVVTNRASSAHNDLTLI